MDISLLTINVQLVGQSLIVQVRDLHHEINGEKKQENNFKMTETKEMLDAILLLWDKEGWTHSMLAKAFNTSEKKIVKLITKAKQRE